MYGKLFIVSAPSGAGKTTLVSTLLQKVRPQYPTLDKVITYTTKMNRPGEKHGRDYYFLTRKQFEEKIEQGFFLEWSTAYGNYYGSPRSILADVSQGKSRIVILDRVGAQQVLATFPSVILVWLYTTNFEVLHDRLKIRAAESPEQIQKRLQLARQELEEEKLTPLYHYYICNNFLDEAVKEFEKILHQELEVAKVSSPKLPSISLIE